MYSRFAKRAWPFHGPWNNSVANSIPALPTYHIDNTLKKGGNAGIPSINGFLLGMVSW
jgi:hypothetical protein